MGEDSIDNDDPVIVTMEINGEYDKVVGKLGDISSISSELEVVMEDFERLIETVEEIDGGTKSVIVDHLPGDMTKRYDSDAVVNAMQVLEQYDVVTLDGNTWKRVR